MSRVSKKAFSKSIEEKFQDLWSLFPRHVAPPSTEESSVQSVLELLMQYQELTPLFRVGQILQGSVEIFLLQVDKIYQDARAVVNRMFKGLRPLKRSVEDVAESEVEAQPLAAPEPDDLSVIPPFNVSTTLRKRGNYRPPIDQFGQFDQFDAIEPSVPLELIEAPLNDIGDSGGETSRDEEERTMFLSSSIDIPNIELGSAEPAGIPVQGAVAEQTEGVSGDGKGAEVEVDPETNAWGRWENWQNIQDDVRAINDINDINDISVKAEPGHDEQATAVTSDDILSYNSNLEDIKATQRVPGTTRNQWDKSINMSSDQIQSVIENFAETMQTWTAVRRQARRKAAFRRVCNPYKLFGVPVPVSNKTVTSDGLMDGLIEESIIDMGTDMAERSQENFGNGEDSGLIPEFGGSSPSQNSQNSAVIRPGTALAQLDAEADIPLNELQLPPVSDTGSASGAGGASQCEEIYGTILNFGVGSFSELLVHHSNVPRSLLAVLQLAQNQRLKLVNQSPEARDFGIEMNI